MKNLPLIFFAMLLMATQLNAQSNSTQNFRVGDIIFQGSNSGQSFAIKLATHSEYSHVGMLIREQGKWAVLEAVQPVKITPLDTWIQRGDRSHYVVKRLKNADQVLNETFAKSLVTEGKKYLGWNYDLEFEWEDKEMYCSELVWKIYKNVLNLELGQTRPLGSYDLSHPAVKAKLIERYGNSIPLKEPMISPQSIFESKLLQTIAEG